MRELKVSVGIWYLGATSDRFVKEGYRPDRTEESIRNLEFGFELLERVPRDELRECFQTSDAIKISQLMRRMLGGS